MIFHKRKRKKETQQLKIYCMLYWLCGKKLLIQDRKLQRVHKKKGVRRILLQENYFQIISFQITPLLKLKTWKVVRKKTSRTLWLHQSLKKRERWYFFRVPLTKSFWCLGMNFLPSSPLLLGSALMPIYIEHIMPYWRQKRLLC